jgi:hypothetical protein
MSNYTLTINATPYGFWAELFDPTDIDGPPIANATGATRDEAVAKLITTITFDNEEN